MRILTAVLAVLVIVIGIGFFAQAPEAQTEALPQACIVSEAYLEAVQENIINLRRLQEMSFATESPINDVEVLSLHQSGLVSARHYHEDIHNDLPECARDFNIAYRDTIVATQDVLTYRLITQTRPDLRRAEQRMNDSHIHLAESWEDMTAAMRVADLQPPPLP